MAGITEILNKNDLFRDDLITLLQIEGTEKSELFSKANEIKIKEIGNYVYFRGLVEFSNICSKDCYYCGIRKSNEKVNRYNLSDEEILNAARFCDKNNFGSIVLQSGEVSSQYFTDRIENLIRQIKNISENRLGITLSLGEQSEEVYQRWFYAGAHRYLLRIETSNEVLYKKLHPSGHSFQTRLDCLKNLQKTGYQTGTGVMIGLPFQTIDDLADDLLFMKELDIDMVGMGPYIEHKNTPLYQYRHELWSIDKRFDMSLKMIALLRILMKDINIAAATALQAIDTIGREKGVRAGANIIMPNVTPGMYRNDYSLYENKPCVNEEPEECLGCLDARISLTDNEIGYNEWGDSRHFKNKANKK
ncbi:MAG: [FeFe] hydrogenase H-cluster radical SAM maturase HydE [Prolixibacteraceae bacterium]|nr:[FeFe] hydrogenase H-cluster radical SAM maturase HydE [Prolixibacteraceae bacterium]